MKLFKCQSCGNLYPFVLSPGVIRKLGFIHELLHDGRATEEPSTSLADALLGSLLPWKRRRAEATKRPSSNS